MHECTWIEKASPCGYLIVSVGSHSPARQDKKQAWTRSRHHTPRAQEPQRVTGGDHPLKKSSGDLQQLEQTKPPGPETRDLRAPQPQEIFCYLTFPVTFEHLKRCDCVKKCFSASKCNLYVQPTELTLNVVSVQIFMALTVHMSVCTLSNL